MRVKRLRFAAPLLALGWIAFAATPSTAEPFEISGGSGRPISIVVRDVPLSEIFEMLSRKEQVNILLGKEVEGNVSVNLFEVSLDHAIRAIADAAGYVAERRRGTYVIIQREEAGKDSASGNTIIRTFKVEYSDPEDVAAIAQKHLSRYGDITVLEGRDFLVLEDLPEFVGRIERLLAEIDRGPRQILIEAKILLITLDDNETFGIDWEKTFNVEDGTATIGARDLAMKGTPGLFFDLLTSDVEIAISALGEKGRVRTLSTPTLLAVEHEEAEVVVGDRLGFRVTTTINQVTTESVEFLESGVILQFTASVDRQGRIVLEIHPEVSTGSIQDGLPQQSTTEVTTKLVTEDGQRVFIAGLIRGQDARRWTGVPFVMDIPIIGYLFRRTERTHVNTETVIILTARVMDDDESAIVTQKVEKTRQVEKELEGRGLKIDRRLGHNPVPGEPSGPDADVPAAPDPD